MRKNYEPASLSYQTAMTVALAVLRRLCAGNGGRARKYDVGNEDEGILTADRLDDPTLRTKKSFDETRSPEKERHSTGK